MANYHAGMVIRNALFRLPVKGSTYRANVPWVTYTDPELAHVGLTEETGTQAPPQDAGSCAGPMRKTTALRPNALTEGFIKVVTSKRGRILGATIVGDHAGELIQTLGLAITKSMKIGAMTSIVSPIRRFRR